MANNSTSLALLLVYAAILLLAATSPPTVAAEGEHRQQVMAMKASSSCNGSIWECMGGEEFEMDSETNWRMLASNDHIGYGAMQRNTVPCSRGGDFSGNCKPAAVANPHKRGCSPITGCRSG